MQSKDSGTSRFVAMAVDEKITVYGSRHGARKESVEPVCSDDFRLLLATHSSSAEIAYSPNCLSQTISSRFGLQHT